VDARGPGRPVVRRVVPVRLGQLRHDAGHGQHEQYQADGHALDAEQSQTEQQRGDHAQLVHDRQHQLHPTAVPAESPGACEGKPTSTVQMIVRSGVRFAIAIPKQR